MTDLAAEILGKMPPKVEAVMALTNRESDALNFVTQLVEDLENLDHDLMAIALVLNLTIKQVANVKRAYLELFNENI